MTYREAVGELKAKFPKAGLSPAVLFDESGRRAANVTFSKHRGGVYAGTDADGTELLVYFNDTANLICCTELDPDRDDG
ncbi:MAG: hypothetical protein ABGY75_05400 [Gemmataceae bacterium]